jgi:hypothetical protein
MELEVLWAPVLLHHLGGLHTFTAYSVEDNELWGRHLVTLVSQVTVALYVFCRSWSSGDRRLLQAAILLFVAGILKLIHKVWALKAASFNNLMSSSLVYPQRRAEEIGILKSCVTTVTHSFIEDATSLRDEEEHDHSLEDYIQLAKAMALTTRVDSRRKHDVENDRWMKRFVDLSAPFTRRLSDISFFWKLCPEEKIRKMKRQLQDNGISFSARRSKPTKVMRASAILCLKDYINKHWYIQHEPQPACSAIIYSVV